MYPLLCLNHRQLSSLKTVCRVVSPTPYVFLRYLRFRRVVEPVQEATGNAPWLLCHLYAHTILVHVPVRLLILLEEYWCQSEDFHSVDCQCSVRASVSRSSDRTTLLINFGLTTITPQLRID